MSDHTAFDEALRGGPRRLHLDAGPEDGRCREDGETQQLPVTRWHGRRIPATS